MANTTTVPSAAGSAANPATAGLSTPGTTGTTLTPARMWRALPILLLGAFLPVLDAFIVNVALANIGTDLGASEAQLELTVSGYGVAYACTLVAGGRLGDRYGRRRLFLAGMAGFTVMSAACGLAPNVTTLIAFRILQGLTAALMFPQVLAAVQAGFEGADRQRAVGMFGVVVGSAGAVGQIVGGLLLEADLFGSDWRPLFLVNVPVGIFALAVAGRVVPETKAPVATRIDVRGAVGLAAAIALLLIPLTLGRSQDWPVWTWICLAAVVPAAVLFVVTQRRMERAGATPLVPPSLLQLPAARYALGAMVVFALSIGGLMFSLAMLLQVGHEFSPIRSGLAMAAAAAGFLLISVYAQRLVGRYGPKLLIVGALLFAAGFAGFAAVAAGTEDALNLPELLGPLFVLGIGWGMVMVPLLGLSLSALPVDRAGLAGGVLSTAMQVGLATGASLLGSTLFSTIGKHPTADDWRTGTLVVAAILITLSLITAALAAKLARVIREAAAAR
ncbi:MFS transporter [Yinghuangia seranimata]|uniref:MFS transporter n=1 Tax=Yinghuangia seranimata TaxID=408067 RepID=UPI00248CC96B|nr:MFS transporter [Yinghuangia seranimata]MDI2129998.1 MFS transporter [Yinghuangia seranimata]